MNIKYTSVSFLFWWWTIMAACPSAFWPERKDSQPIDLLVSRFKGEVKPHQGRHMDVRHSRMADPSEDLFFSFSFVWNRCGDKQTYRTKSNKQNNKTQEKITITKSTAAAAIAIYNNKKTKQFGFGSLPNLPPALEKFSFLSAAIFCWQAYKTSNIYLFAYLLNYVFGGEKWCIYVFQFSFLIPKERRRIVEIICHPLPI